MTEPTAHPRSREQIEQDLAQARAGLAEHLGTLVEEVHPKALVRRVLNGIKAQASDGLTRFKGVFRDEHGWRPDTAVKIAGLVAGAILLATLGHGLKKLGRGA